MPPTRWAARPPNSAPATHPGGRPRPRATGHPLRQPPPRAGRRRRQPPEPARRASSAPPLRPRPRGPRSRRGDSPGAQHRQHAPARRGRQRERPESPPGQSPGERRRLQQQLQDERGHAERADVAAPHHLQRPGPVPPTGGEAVDGVREPVEVQTAGRGDEQGQREAGRHQVTRAGSHGERADGGRGHGEQRPATGASVMATAAAARSTSRGAGTRRTVSVPAARRAPSPSAPDLTRRTPGARRVRAPSRRGG